MNERKINDGEIDLMRFIRVLLDKKRIIITTGVISLLLGVIVALTTSNEYKSSCILLPEVQQKQNSSLGSLGSLAGLAGINLDLGQSSSMSPRLYPELVRSSLFLDEIVYTPIYFEQLDSTLSGFQYLKEVHKPGLFKSILAFTLSLPARIKGDFRSEENTALNGYDLVRYSKEDWKIINSYVDRLSIEVDDETGTIMLSSEMPDPVAAAKTTDLMMKELTKTITNYKLEKLQASLVFIQSRYEESKLEYQRKQEDLAFFTDKNRNISNSLAETEYKRLQNEMEIAFEVYKGLATQLEQAKIKVKENTPVFKILDPIKIPVDKYSPDRKLVVAVFCFLGIVLSSLFVLVRARMKDKNVFLIEVA